MWDLAPTLEGRLVRLEPLAERHLTDLFAAARPAEIWAWWPFNPGADEAAFRRWFDTTQQAALEGTSSHFATLDARTGAPLGSTSFCTPRPEDRGIEIGWTWLTPAAWNTGANVEAKLLQLGYAFETLGCLRVEFDTDAENERSRRALSRLPAVFEGVLRDWRIIPDGRVRSSAYYSILAREWPEVRDNLTARVQARLTGAGAPPAPPDH